MTPAWADKKQKSNNAQPKIAAYAVGFYNLENLFDTIHAQGKNDYDFLPDGSYKWNTVKYENKLKNMSRVLSEMATDKVKAGCAVIGISEIENRQVVLDVLKQESLKNRGYKVLHFESPDRRGVDCGLLYNPRFFTLEDSLYVLYIYPNDSTGERPLGFVQDPETNDIKPLPLYGDTTHITRGFLVGIGTMAGEKMAVIVNHWPSRGAQSIARERAGYQVYALKEALLKKYPGIKIIIEGDLNDDPNNKSVVDELKAVSEVSDVKDAHSLYNPWYNMLYKVGQGTLLYKGKWNLFDQIILSGNFIVGNPQPDASTSASEPAQGKKAKKGNKDNAAKSYNQLTYRSHEVFLRDYLIQQDGRYKGSPLRTTAGGTWLNGYSDHLPTIVYLVKEK
ncbi:MAG: endonuclease/exonuclease/phosphatase family protein [Bacteroidales bacterium]|nr:endonuclease/exonuclease/phosphatase family protein [Bacteroidales bacterium]